MNEQGSFDVQAAVAKILDALEVARVVVVDDANVEGVELEQVIAHAKTLDSDLLLEAFPELGDKVPDDQEVLATQIRNVWASFDRSAQVEKGDAVLRAARRSDGDEPDDLGDLAILREFIPSEKLVMLSPAQWHEQQQELISYSISNPTLFLFDQDFSKAGGASGDGIRIIASLLASESNEKLICALLTHTVQPDAQFEKWEELSKAHGIPKDRFMVLPKLLLSQSPIQFVQTLKFAALAPNFAELKSKTTDIIAKAASFAAKRVEKVSIYDLDHIVFRAPATEGLWEPEMLFRLHSMFHRVESHRMAHEGGHLEMLAAKLRAVSCIPMNYDSSQAPNSAWELQREELYDFDYTNKNHLPIDLGDIFQKVGPSKKRYILLSQPCDLMVRASGRREPESSRLPLVEIAPATRDDRYAEKMPYFAESPGIEWLVKFKRVSFVQARVLDLCVFNDDGMAKLSIDNSVPAGLRPAWQKRHKLLHDCWEKVVNKADSYKSISNDVASKGGNIVQDAIRMSLHDDLFKGEIVEEDGQRSIYYKCKRVGRLSRARAMGLLMSYTATLARPAYDLDFLPRLEIKE